MLIISIKAHTFVTISHLLQQYDLGIYHRHIVFSVLCVYYPVCLFVPIQAMTDRSRGNPPHFLMPRNLSMTNSNTLIYLFTCVTFIFI